MSTTDLHAQRGPDALRRMRRYTTITFCVTIAVVVAVPVIRSPASPVVLGATILAAVAAVVISAFWEGPAPRWLAIAAVAVSLGAWTLGILSREDAGVAIPAAMILAVLATHHRAHRMAAAAVGAVLLVLPLLIVALAQPEYAWSGWFVVAIGCYAFLWIMLRFNDYGWGLFLQLDEARQAARTLAIVQERYRMAADLHDIQGHTLHVIRLTMQVARRTIPTDPDAAIEQLKTAEALVVQTVAETRALVSGDRVVTVASELANARALFDAAGIACTVEGEVAPDADELLALLLRESTTNILRHAQAGHVRIDLDRGAITITNDGAPDAMRAGGGLARLAERFEARGGRLIASTDAGWFRVEGRFA